jgi:hypothetical protein
MLCAAVGFASCMLFCGLEARSISGSAVQSGFGRFQSSESISVGGDVDQLCGQRQRHDATATAARQTYQHTLLDDAARRFAVQTVKFAGSSCLCV